MQTRGTVRLLIAAAAASAALSFASSAAAAIPSAFDGTLACAVQGDGTRKCDGIVNSFDGAPIDVNLFLPPAPGVGPDGDFPLVMEFHGWGGSKLSDSAPWTDDGYAYFSVSDRGWGNSCGGTDPKRLTPGVCDEGFNHLMDTRYEVRDAQELVGLLVDDGIVDPDAIAPMGSSYGGGISMALAALENRKMLPNDTLVPWTSPDGTPIAITAAAPDIPWSDLSYSLMPNGRTLDYVADAPYSAGPIGVMKQSFVTGLYGLGLPLSNYAPAGTEPDADLTGWYALISAGEPYDGNPLAADLVDEISSHHSSYYIDDSVKPPPMLISNGFTDDLFPPDEAIRFYNRTKDTYPDAKISLFFSDHGHQRGQNKGPDRAKRLTLVHELFDHYLKGDGAEPTPMVETLTQVCGADSDGPFTAATWKDIAPGEVHFADPTAKLIAPEAGDPTIGQAYDPISGSGACATGSASDQPGLANYRLDPAPAGGFTLMGSPTIVADLLSAGPNSQLAARLLDVDPGSGQQTLVARGLYRPLTGTEASRQVFQLHPNGYHFAEGHVAKLELLPNDFPYSRKSNGQAPITVANLELRLPVLEAPGTAGAEAPAPKVVPAGYDLAPDYSGPIDSDGDGIADGDDDCPAEPGPAGPAGSNGCPLPDPPDADNDGIPDDVDACPDDAGPASNNGCPVTDSDGDGIADGDDHCPHRPGPLSNDGCPVPPPDGDGDGVPDAEDACPEDPGPEENFGCPYPKPADGDGDGVPDDTDACPTEAGPASNDGCPETEEPPAACSRKLVGTDKPDRIRGTKGSERIAGRRGGDRIKARGGDDCVDGQGGNDLINGGRGGDVIRGGRGNDRINSKDHTRDVVRCGRGNDSVRADRRDRLIGCERRR